MRQKSDKNFEIRSRELALQERVQALAEKKFELENWERKKKIEMEEKKIHMEVDIFNNQQKMLEIGLSYG